MTGQREEKASISQLKKNEASVLSSLNITSSKAAFLHAGNEPNAYYFHADHLGSTSAITDANGSLSQHVLYFAFGEPTEGSSRTPLKHKISEQTFVEEHRNSINSPYLYNGKEYDEETSRYYYGARYYDPRISLWIGVDPLAEKYPSMSTYNYCANNPINYFDPDGNKIIAGNHKSKKFIKAYLKEHFGSSNMFRFNGRGEMKIRNNRFNTYIKEANPNQVDLLNGLKSAIKKPEKAVIHINKKSDNFHVLESRDNIDYTRDVNTDNSGLTMAPFGEILNYHIFINNERAENEPLNSPTMRTRMIGKDDPVTLKGETGKSASSTFFHEVLDEFLNYFTEKKVNDSSPQSSKVSFQNSALKNIGKTIRDGTDHQ